MSLSAKRSACIDLARHSPAQWSEGHEADPQCFQCRQDLLVPVRAKNSEYSLCRAVTGCTAWALRMLYARFRQAEMLTLPSAMGSLPYWLHLLYHGGSTWCVGKTGRYGRCVDVSKDFGDPPDAFWAAVQSFGRHAVLETEIWWRSPPDHGSVAVLPPTISSLVKAIRTYPAVSKNVSLDS